MRTEAFGIVDGQAVQLFTLSNSHGMQVTVSNYGGILQRIDVPDRNGESANVALGFTNLDDYIQRSPFFGALVGRYGNRIAYGKFTLDGQQYQLPINNAPARTARRAARISRPGLARQTRPTRSDSSCP